MRLEVSAEAEAVCEELKRAFPHLDCRAESQQSIRLDSSKWIAFRNLLWKDMRSYYPKPPNVSWGLVFPLAWTAGLAAAPLLRSPP
jgi:hypothetical protein